MADTRINPETGVIEENIGLGIWQSWKNENGCKQRINPKTGVVEQNLLTDGTPMWTAKK